VAVSTDSTFAWATDRFNPPKLSEITVRQDMIHFI
jgi:hypothetical protein